MEKDFYIKKTNSFFFSQARFVGKPKVLLRSFWGPSEILLRSFWDPSVAIEQGQEISGLARFSWYPVYRVSDMYMCASDAALPCHKERNIFCAYLQTSSHICNPLGFWKFWVYEVDSFILISESELWMWHVCSIRNFHSSSLSRFCKTQSSRQFWGRRWRNLDCFSLFAASGEFWIASRFSQQDLIRTLEGPQKDLRRTS